MGKNSDIATKSVVLVAAVAFAIWFGGWEAWQRYSLWELMVNTTYQLLLVCAIALEVIAIAVVAQRKLGGRGKQPEDQDNVEKYYQPLKRPSVNNAQRREQHANARPDPRLASIDKAVHEINEDVKEIKLILKLAPEPKGGNK